MAPIIKAFVITLIATTIIFGCYEWFLRSHNYTISYDDEGGTLFADIRRKVYMPKDKATVMLGSSRMKFDLDIDTWKENTGETAIQLANVGSSPILILRDLAEDPKFAGKVIIDVTPSAFFDLKGNMSRRPKEKIEYYKKETIAQRWSFHINDLLESQLVFLDKENFSLSSILKKSEIFPNREGKKEFPPYPTDFGRVTRERQELLGYNFMHDTAQINQMTRVWTETTLKSDKRASTPQKQIDSLIFVYKENIQKILARNGQVIFIRPPSSGKALEMETRFFPDEKYWDRLLALTGIKGIDFKDYNSLQNFNCIEMSHLSQPDAAKYTAALIQILKEEQFF